MVVFQVYMWLTSVMNVKTLASSRDIIIYIQHNEKCMCDISVQYTYPGRGVADLKWGGTHFCRETHIPRTYYYSDKLTRRGNC